MPKALRHLMLSSLTFSIVFALVNAWPATPAPPSHQVPVLEQIAAAEGPDLGVTFACAVMWVGLADAQGATESGGRTYEASDGKRITSAGHGFETPDDATLAFEIDVHLADEVLAQGVGSAQQGKALRRWAVLKQMGDSGPVFMYLELRDNEIWEVDAPTRRHLWEFVRAQGRTLTSPQTLVHGNDGRDGGDAGQLSN